MGKSKAEESEASSRDMIRKDTHYSQWETELQTNSSGVIQMKKVWQGIHQVNSWPITAPGFWFL